MRTKDKDVPNQEISTKESNKQIVDRNGRLDVQDTRRNLQKMFWTTRLNSTYKPWRNNDLTGRKRRRIGP